MTQKYRQDDGFCRPSGTNRMDRRAGARVDAHVDGCTRGEAAMMEEIDELCGPGGQLGDNSFARLYVFALNEERRATRVRFDRRFPMKKAVA